MIDLAQEHYDHEAGAFANELQAGYALSMQYQPRRVADEREIDRLIRNGFYVVVAETARYCAHTDALLPGCNSWIDGIFADRATAYEHAVELMEETCGEYSARII